MEQNEQRLCYTIRFRTSKEKEHTMGREVVKRRCGTLSEMTNIAQGILAGLCTIGGYNHGYADIYETSEISDKIARRISW